MFKKKTKEEKKVDYEFSKGLLKSAEEKYDGGITIPDDEYKKMAEQLKKLNLGPYDYFDSGIDYKFNEDILIDEFKNYVDTTYDQHYAKDKFQATEFIIDGGHGMGFCIGNVMKYAQRYGKKGSHADARKDLLKVLHYALIGLYVHDTMDEQE